MVTIKQANMNEDLAENCIKSLQGMRVGIVGLGLIGGSLAIALKDSFYVYGYDSNASSVSFAQSRGMIHEGGDISRLKGLDLIYVCVPVWETKHMMEKVYQIVGDSAIITDVASVKGMLTHSSGRVVGGHPMAGTEFSGIRAAKAHLFENRYYCLTPLKGTLEQDLQLVAAVAQHILKAKTITLSVLQHDEAVSRVSHLPHMTAYTLSHAVMGSLTQIAGSGFMDTTRIASSQPRFWAEVARLNKDNILSSMNAFAKDFERLKEHIEHDRFDDVLTFFEDAKRHRDGFTKNE